MAGSSMKRALVLAVAALLAGCRSPTQITFQVTTDVRCQDLQSTQIVAGSLDVLSTDRPATTTAPKCATEGHIGSLVVVPSAADDELVAVKITTGVSVPPDQCGPQGQGCIVAKRALHYLPHQPLVVDVPMNASCEGVYCPGEETCVDGQCRSAIIGDPGLCTGSGCDPGVLTPEDGGGAPVDGSAPVDGAPVDATLPTDGPSDAEVDATLDAPVTPDAAGDATSEASVPFDAGPPSPAVSIGLADFYGCALLADKTVKCWGNDLNGFLGVGYEDASTFEYVPTRVPGLADVVSLAVSSDAACVAFGDGGVSCWGYVGNGATGTGDSDDDLVPTRLFITDTQKIGMVAAGVHHMCAATTDGHTIWCWGLYQDHYDGTSLATLVPSVDAGLLEMHGGIGVTCGRFDDGTVRCWGGNEADMLGQGDALDGSTPSAVPLVVQGVPPSTQLCVGGDHACVVSTTHQLYCWGETDLGALGMVDAGAEGGAAQIGVATRIPFIDPHVTQVTCGWDTTCVLYDDAGTQCFGYDYDNELGFPYSGGAIFTAPQTVPNLGPATTIYGGALDQCAALVDGGVACWGNNNEYELGGGKGVNDDAGPNGAVPVSF
jgi:hypothetical protein